MPTNPDRSGPPIRPAVRAAIERAIEECAVDLEYLQASDLLDPERLDIVRRALLRLAAAQTQDGTSTSLSPNLPGSRNPGHT